jgi:hypothetical protein
LDIWSEVEVVVVEAVVVRRMEEEEEAAVVVEKAEVEPRTRASVDNGAAIFILG